MDMVSLFEMDWYEKSPMTAVLQRNRGRFIHFSQGAPNRDWHSAKLIPEPERPSSYHPRTAKRYQRDMTTVQRKNAIYPVPKMGINPRSMWKDPKGIYFYPVNWLLSGHERIRIGQQHGINYRYYYIVELDLSDPNGINLDTVTWPQIEAIAKRNGWFDQMQEFRGLSPEDQTKHVDMHYARPDVPASFFWHFIDRNVKNGEMSWASAYKGVSFIRDPNLSIIHKNEPDQVLVLDPRIIKVVEFGENKLPQNFSDQDKLTQWMHALLTIIKQVRGEYGGDIVWNKQRPTLTFAKGSGRFTLTIPERRTMGSEVGLSLAYTYGRAEDSMYIEYKDLAKLSLPEIVQMIATRVEQIAGRKTDLLFRPIMSIEEGKRLMINQMADHLGLSINTTIHNSDTQRYDSVMMLGDVQREINQVLIKTRCFLRLGTNDMDGSCNLWAGRHHLISAPSTWNEEFNDPTPMLRSIAVKAHENLALMLRSFGPQETGQSGFHDRNPRFSTAEEATAMTGWLILNSGLSLGGTLAEVFAAEIEAFNAYPDKRVLLSDIAYVLNSRY